MQWYVLVVPATQDAKVGEIPWFQEFELSLGNVEKLLFKQSYKDILIKKKVNSRNYT